MFAVLAILCFLLATLNVSLGGLNLIALGLVFVAASLLVGNWPIRGDITRR